MIIHKDVDQTIKNWIYKFEVSERRKYMEYGSDYYRSKNTEIMARRMLMYAPECEGYSTEMIKDPYKANNKLASGFFKLLVDQKVNYSLGKPITLDSKQSEIIWEILGNRFQSKLKALGKEASKKALAWAYCYIDKNEMLQIKQIPSEQVIPMYSDLDSEELEAVVRYYTVNVDGKILTRVEVWDANEVTYYQNKTQAGPFFMLNNEQMEDIFNAPSSNPRPHLFRSKKYGDTEVKKDGLNWGRVPFIPLFNNDEEDTDLQAIKNYIDVYDIVESDFANNLEDFQDIYWILKGYQGENVAEFLSQVKRYKTLKVAEDGDARAEKLEVPYQARMTELNNLAEKIYTFGQGVNLEKTGDGNITNVVIRSRFANLDLKASQFEQEIEDFMFKLMYFVNKYLEMNNMQQIELDGITFNRTIIVNEIEMLDANTKQKGMISEKTRLSNHPWIDDYDEESEQIEEEKIGQVPLLDEVGENDGNNERAS